MVRNKTLLLYTYIYYKNKEFGNPLDPCFVFSSVHYFVFLSFLEEFFFVLVSFLFQFFVFRQFVTFSR